MQIHNDTLSPVEEFARQHAPKLASLWRELLGSAESEGCDLTPELLEASGRWALLRLGLGQFNPRLQQLALETMAGKDARLRRFAYGAGTDAAAKAAAQTRKAA